MKANFFSELNSGETEYNNELFKEERQDESL